SCVVMASPGIDAADDADPLMTESAVHVIDVLFYVIDYNHVQSEVNLYFLQEMRKRKLPVYIIINQVDKHNDAELSFQDYDEKVKQTFDQWNISPEAIYYTSVMQPDNIHNQLSYVKKTLFKMMESPHASLSQIEHNFVRVVEEHQSFIREQMQQDTSDASLDQESKNEMDTLLEKLQEIKSHKEQLQKDFMNEVQTTL